MKLFHSPTSPYVRKVRVTVREKGLTGKVEDVAVNSMEDGTPLLAHNPLSKVPTLLLDDGTALFDSPVICEYLDAQAANPVLIPAKGPERWEVLRHQAMTDGLMDAAFAYVMELRREESERSAMWMARWLGAINRCVDVLEAEIGQLGGAVTLAHIGAGCALGYLDLRYTGIVDWRRDHPALATWYAGFAERPSMQETVPPG